MSHRPLVRGGVTLAVAATMLLLAGCGTPPAPREAPTPRATAQPSPTTSPTAPATPRPTAAARIPAGTQLTDISFVSPTLGFALGENCVAAPTCRAVVVATTDGGTSWTASSAPPAAVGSTAVTTTPSEPVATVGRLTFANPLDGWAWGPGLYATSNGAVSWAKVAAAGPVLGLTVVGGEVWAVEADCGGATGGACPLVLETAPISGGTWSPLAGVPAVDAMSASLAATAGGDAWLEAAVPAGAGSGTSLLLDATGDGGATWAARTVPCPLAPPGTTDPLAAYGSATLWIGCVSEPGAGSQSKAIYTSADGGASWSLAGSSGPAAAGVPAALGRVPIAGYLEQLVLNGPQVGWMALARGTLMVSRDGGRTWSPAISAQAVAAGSGVVRLSLAGSSAFAIADGVTLPTGSPASAAVYRSTDAGASWSAVPLG
ncbi:MAG TPA: hypothetical protein VMW47_02395 [Verrucomicrobiae bacterium]|nr:hypothetical protein [Verrucomicrobiae bacterium]